MNSSLVNESLLLSKDIIDLHKILISYNDFIISKQVLRSSTSIGANIREAQYAESKLDFIHKLKISLKECNETLYWLELISYMHRDKNIELNHLNIRCKKILNTLSKSILTTKRNLNN